MTYCQGGKMAENEQDTGQDPGTPATPDESNNEPTAAPDWFMADKYKTIDDQAKAASDAVREMKESQLRAKEAERELQNLREQLEAATNRTPKVDLNNANSNLIEKLEEEFGKPFAQIKAEADLQSLIVDQKLAPLKNVILSQQYETQLDKMEQKNELFKKYRPAVEKKLMSRPIEERASVSAIKGAWNEVIAENIEDIRNEAIELGKKTNSAAPATPPNVNGGGGGVIPTAKKVSLSEDEKLYYSRVGANPDEIEESLAKNQSRAKETGWNKLFE
jgi:hypothetical protein